MLSESYIYYLTSEDTRNWRQLLKFGKTLDINERRKFLWSWPNEGNLREFQLVLKQLSIDTLLSIGCGNGLLEWILKQSIGVNVFGLEFDRAWWQSKYAIRSFIPLNFYEDLKQTKSENDSRNMLLECCPRLEWNFALLFCYFNNRIAFANYLNMYKGNYIIIIGPNSDSNIHTNPSALEPNFPNNEWHLHVTLKLDENDVVAFYKKITKNIA
ncbi:uncharacterized protein LOC119685709 [Teleopsis dalmanni]|uniref:uncharacterized protein LOC119685709 n=1 Tax=Teleopsis dalmanni TaxID=139649 RepID=UPI000D32C1C1|nr:uncharacterized protein LOC119685709 [Teleopsis dalmanni]